MALPTLEDLLAPIKGSNPGGESLRYDPVYEEIKEARREDAGYVANPDRGPGEAPIYEVPPKVPDWVKVSKLCTGVLTKRSKDLQIAAWFAEGLTMTKGFAGCRDGLKLMKGLHADFWESCYPEVDEGDMEGRANVFSFFDRQVALALRRAPLTRAPGMNFSWLEWSESRRSSSDEPRTLTAL